GCLVRRWFSVRHRAKSMQRTKRCAPWASRRIATTKRCVRACALASSSSTPWPATPPCWSRRARSRPAAFPTKIRKVFPHGKAAQALVFHDPSDRPLLEAQTDATRPSGEQILLLARALEGMPTGGGAITTEALALAARSSRRAVEALAELLDGMGVVAHRDG